MSLKTADQILEDINKAVRAPVGCRVTIAEINNPMVNWVARSGEMPWDATARFELAIARLRKANPIIDWRDIPKAEGHRRMVAKWFSCR